MSATSPTPTASSSAATSSLSSSSTSGSHAVEFARLLELAGDLEKLVEFRKEQASIIAESKNAIDAIRQSKMLVNGGSGAGWFKSGDAQSIATHTLRIQVTAALVPGIS